MGAWCFVQGLSHNPFNPTTAIQFSVPVQSVVVVKVNDILGRESRTVINETKNPGTYKILFDATGLASGTYFYRMEAGSYVETKKLLLLKQSALVIGARENALQKGEAGRLSFLLFCNWLYWLRFVINTRLLVNEFRI